MKKSEIYHLAQVTVLESGLLATETALQVIKTLMADEDLARFNEGREE